MKKIFLRNRYRKVGALHPVRCCSILIGSYLKLFPLLASFQYSMGEKKNRMGIGGMLGENAISRLI